MNLESLKHLVKAARTLADDCEVVVIGSASLLASHPELGEPDGPLAQTFDADLCPQPYDEATAVMLDQALGESKAFHLRHGYHADIVRPAIFDTLPQGWRDRLVTVPGTEGAMALDPHDLAAVKILVGRSKDLDLVRMLMDQGRLSQETIRQRLALIEMDERLLSRSSRTFHALTGGQG
jgi:hypothetical protein